MLNMVSLALHKRLKAAAGNLFVGKVSCGTTMNQTKRLDSVFKSCSRYAGLIGPCFPLSPTASLRVVGRECHTPLPDWGGRRKPFVQGWTHTSRRLRRFFKTPPTVEPVDENLFPRGGHTHTHRAVFGAVKVVVRPGASSSVLTPRGTFVQKAPNCWRNKELVDT